MFTQHLGEFVLPVTPELGSVHSEVLVPGLGRGNVLAMDIQL